VRTSVTTGRAAAASLAAPSVVGRCAPGAALRLQLRRQRIAGHRLGLDDGVLPGEAQPANTVAASRTARGMGRDMIDGAKTSAEYRQAATQLKYEA
jgi:hypothetical protein